MELVIDNCQDYDDKRLKDQREFTLILATIFILFLWPVGVLATSEPVKLTDFTKTLAFSGSMEIVSKLNWVGWFISAVISVFSFIGLALTFLQMMTTYLYLGCRPLWDQVHELKTGAANTRFLGVEGLVTQVKSGKYGTGLDAIFALILTILPDFKDYSYYKDGRREHGIEDDDSVITFTLKVAAPTILVLFFYTVGWSGTLWQGYGTVVDVLATVADTAVEVNLNSYAERIMSNGSGYSFTFDEEGTNYGSFKQKVAKSVYVAILKESKDLSTESKYLIGQGVESWVESKVGKDLASFLGEYSTFLGPGQYDDDDAEGFKVSVEVSGTEISGPAITQLISGNGGIVPGLTAEDPTKVSYLKVYFSKKSISNMKNYLAYGDSDAVVSTKDNLALTRSVAITTLQSASLGTGTDVTAYKKAATNGTLTDAQLTAWIALYKATLGVDITITDK